MTYEQFNRYCGSLPATTYVMQWGGSHVWKVGDKDHTKWLQHYDKPGLSNAELKLLLRSSHHLASLNLSKKKQKELGLNQN
jgi:predicted DNA-binding protein (MmcQ/YjbR family)